MKMVFFLILPENCARRRTAVFRETVLHRKNFFWFTPVTLGKFEIFQKNWSFFEKIRGKKRRSPWNPAEICYTINRGKQTQSNIENFIFCGINAQPELKKDLRVRHRFDSGAGSFHVADFQNALNVAIFIDSGIRQKYLLFKYRSNSLVAFK